jgi:hypothetical protein
MKQSQEKKKEDFLSGCSSPQHGNGQEFVCIKMIHAASRHASAATGIYMDGKLEQIMCSITEQISI